MSKEPTRTPSPEFSDPVLQRAFDQNAPFLEKYGERRVARLDQVSESIKSIERYLQASAVREPVSLCFSGDPDSSYDEKEWVEWATLQKEERWRLLYRHEAWVLRDDPDVADDERRCEFDVRPLIETPHEVRLRAYEALPLFLTQLGKACASKLGLQHPEDARTAYNLDDPPF